MLIQNLKHHFTKKIKGVIHIGAHLAQEKLWYSENQINNIIWIEANDEFENQLRNIVGEDKIIIVGVDNINGKTNLNISNNGQSSSLLELNLHKKYYPDVFYTETKEINVKRMVDIIKENNINMDDYNFLNIDIQGKELDALKSFDSELHKVDYIYTEVNTNFLYSECSLLNEIDEFLKKFGFDRVEINMTPNEWGDAFYVKK